MKLTADQIESLINQIAALKAEYSDEYQWGVRFDELEVPVGHVFAPSRIWIDGDPTDELLTGTCAIRETRIKQALRHTVYHGHAYVVCGLESGYGEDDGEIILRDCEVMASA